MNSYWDWDFNENFSPYYNDSHYQFRRKVRNFVETEIKPFVDEWEEKETYPIGLHKKAYNAGIYACMWPAKYGGTPPAKNVDIFHDVVFHDELARSGCGGVLASCFFSFTIALPPLLAEGMADNSIRDKVAREVITAEKIMSLAVTEPFGGSDVAGIKTTAKLTPDKKHYIVNGSKTLITSGPRAHYLTTAVRTGDDLQHGGLSLLLIETSLPGVRIERMKTQGWKTSGTASIYFENVKVPTSHLIGKENCGFKPIMLNFNHERFTFSVMANRYSRLLLEDAIAYAQSRKTFGKRLIDHQVIRHKIGEMIRHILATHSLLETVGFRWESGAFKDGDIGGQIALAKVQATKVFEFCAREASQILGGKSFVIGGRGGLVERLYREVRVSAIGAGSEEVMLDLAVNRAKL